MSLDKLVNKGFVRYTKKHFPDEADMIIKKANELYPKLHSKAPDIGGSANNMAYNLDMMITAVSYYEASDHRIGGEAFGEIARALLKKYGFVKKFININKPWQMRLLKKAMYNRYVPYSKLVEEKLSKGEWGNTWRVRINPGNIDEGVAFDLVGCPLADYAKANGYEAMYILPLAVMRYLRQPQIPSRQDWSNMEFMSRWRWLPVCITAMLSYR